MKDDNYFFFKRIKFHELQKTAELCERPYRKLITNSIQRFNRARCKFSLALVGARPFNPWRDRNPACTDVITPEFTLLVTGKLEKENHRNGKEGYKGCLHWDNLGFLSRKFQRAPRFISIHQGINRDTKYKIAKNLPKNFPPVAIFLSFFTIEFLFGIFNVNWNDNFSLSSSFLLCCFEEKILEIVRDALEINEPIYRWYLFSYFLSLEYLCLVCTFNSFRMDYSNF